MIRSFRLRDSYLLQKLARQRVPLHLERHLTQPRWPLGLALSAPVPWHGSGAATFVVNRQSSDNNLTEGFVQASKHLGRSEADVCYIAPRLGRDEKTPDTWRALLKHLGAHAGDFGIQRLYACLPAQEEAAAIVASSGFILYARETLFRLRAPRQEDTSPGVDHIRAQRKLDSFALQRLSDRYTPPVIQKAEGAFLKEEKTNADLHHILQNWWQPDRMTGLVYVEDDRIQGAVRIRRGSKGHWLHFLGDAARQDMMAALLNQALRQLQQDNRPIYCGVRAYQSALGPVLMERSFEPGVELARFVKYATVHVREPASAKSRLMVKTSFPSVISSDAAPKIEISMLE